MDGRAGSPLPAARRWCDVDSSAIARRRAAECPPCLWQPTHGRRITEIARLERISTFSDHRILMLITRGATAQQTQHVRTRVPKLVPLAGQNRNRISLPHVLDFLVDTNSSHSVGDVINLLRHDVIMFLCAHAGSQSRLRQTLVADG